MNTGTQTFLLTALFALTVPALGCGSWIAMEHTSKPGTVTTPYKDFVRLAKTPQGPAPASVDISETVATLLYLGGGTIATVTVDFSRIERVVLLNNAGKGRWTVDIEGPGAKRVFRFHAQDEKQAREMVDVVAEVRSRASH